jgi:hypothetical protein
MVFVHGSTGKSTGGVSIPRIATTAETSVRFATDSLSGITTDTGAFAPGGRDFSRFTLPEQCVGAVQEATDDARHSLAVRYRLLTLQDSAPELDTLPQAAVRIARACGARFALAQTAPTDLPSLFTLALMQGNDTLANAVLHRQLSAATTPDTQEAVLADAVWRYLTAEPARVAAAEVACAVADSIAKKHQENSLPVHDTLLSYARRTFNRPLIRRVANRIIDMGHVVPFAKIQYQYQPLVAAYSALLEVAFFESPDSLTAITQRAKADLSRFPPGRQFPPGYGYAGWAANYKKATIEEIKNGLLGFDPGTRAGGAELPPIEAAYWFPAKVPAWPPRGHVSLLIYDRSVPGCVRGDMNILIYPLHGCGMIHTYLPQWTAQYGSAGFDLTMIVNTKGYAVRSIALSPAAEADTIAWYLRTYRKLPATVAVVQSAVRWQVPLPDGRRELDDTTQLGTKDIQLDWKRILTILYGRDGTLLYAGSFKPMLLSALLWREFNGHTSAALSPAASTAVSPSE